MKTSDALQLKPDEEILHNRYGKSKVIKVVIAGISGILFGVIIRPLTEEGLVLLACDSETHISNFLEDSVRQIRIIQ